MNSTQQREYAGTQAIHRAIAVLRAFMPDAESLTPAEVSRRAGLNRSTTYRLLSALAAEGLVVVDGGGRYRLGPELIVLGGLALRQTDVRSAALPHLHALARESGETVDLEVLRGASTMIVEEVAGDRVLSASANLGRTYPAALTSTGKALLAHLPPAELDALVAPGDPLRAELALARARGYATSYEELEAFLHAVGAPIFDHAGRAVAAVSISGPAARMPREREAQLAAPVVAACRAISEELGFRTTTPAAQGAA